MLRSTATGKNTYFYLDPVSEKDIIILVQGTNFTGSLPIGNNITSVKRNYEMNVSSTVLLVNDIYLNSLLSLYLIR